MTIKLHIKSPTMHVDALLKPEAMPGLLKLIEEHQLAELPEDEYLRGPHGPPLHRGRRMGGPPEWMEQAPELSAELSAFAQETSKKVSSLKPEEILEKTEPTTFPEKFIIVIGWLESHSGRPIRPEIKATFSRWPIEPSGNPARDFKTTVSSGWVSKSGREIGLTEEGWKKLAEMMGVTSASPTAS